MAKKKKKWWEILADSKSSKVLDTATTPGKRQSSAYQTPSSDYQKRKPTTKKSNTSAKKQAKKQTTTSKNSRVQDVAPYRQRETSTYNTPKSDYNKRDKVANSTSALSRSKNSRVQDIAPLVTTTQKKKDDRTWFQKSEAFKDGYQFGDVTKTILGSATDVVENLTSGVMGMGEAIVDASAYLAPGAYIANQTRMDMSAPDFKLYNEMESEMDKFIKKDLYNEQAIARKIISDPMKNSGFDALGHSVFGEKSDALVQSAGQLGATAGLQVLGVPWFMTTGVTSFGGEVENALNEGATHAEAGGSALISAGAEILSEKLSGGISFGGKTLDDTLVKNLTTRISDKTIRSLTKAGIDAVGEGSEEVVSSVFSRLGSALYKEENIDELLTSEEAMDEYIESFIGGAVLGGASSVVNATKSNAQGKDFATGLSDNELKVAQVEINNRIAEKEADGSKVTTKEKNAITQQVYKDLEKGYISVDTIESTLGGETYKKYKDSVDNETKLQQEYDELNKMKLGEMTGEQVDRKTELKTKLDELKENSNKSEMRFQLDNEISNLIANDKLLQESYNERSRRGQTFEADINKYDAKQQEIIKRATESGILNNTNRTHEFVDMVAKISADKGVLFDFTNNEKLKESGFAMDGKTINGYVKDGNIAVNINSNKALNTIVGHEITHVLEGTELYTELQNAVKEYATTKGEYQARYDAFKRLYKDVDGAVIDNEVTADLVGDYLFTDADFVSRLSAEKPNVFKKIYDEIKYFVKTITSGKEARELEKLKRAFDKAYKDSANASKDTKYSVSDKNIKDVMNDYASGESYYTMSYTQDGKVVATLEYSEYDGEPNVKMIEVEPEYRRKGIGTKLLQELQRKYPNTEISFGMSTPDGTKLLESATYTVENKDVTDKLARIKEIQKVLDKYDEGYNNFFENDIEIPDNYAEDYNDLYDEKVALQQELRGKKKTKTFVKTDTKYSLSEDSKGNKLSPAVQKRFENSKAVDEDGNLKVLYHGTPGGEFYIFDKSKGSVEGDFGSGFYFTDNESDVESNYEGGGPDFENKVARRAEQIEMDEEIDYDEAEERAREELFKGSGKFEVYLNIENPAIVGKTMLFEQDKYLEEYDENDYDDYDEYIGEVEQLVADDIDNIVWEVEKNVDVYSTDGLSDVLFEAYAEGGISVEDLKSKVNELYLEDEYGNLVGNEVTRQIIESLGYDGIIDNTVSKKFRNMGLDADTTHYIVFKPNQIKNITNQNPTDNPDVRYSLSEDSDGKKLSKEQSDYFKDSKVRDENGNLKVMYHGTGEGGFHEFKIADDGQSFFFTDNNETAKSYSGTHENYTAQTFRTADEFNEFFKSIDADEYEVAEENGQFVLYEDGDEVATSDTAKGIYDEFRDWTGLGTGSANYKVYLDIKNPLTIDGENNNWDEINVPSELKASIGETADTRTLSKYAKENGYDGVIINNVIDNGLYASGIERFTPSTVAIAFDSNQIKSVDNAKPTLDPDIRYSLSEDEFPQTQSEYAPLTEAEANERDAMQGRLQSLKDGDIPPEIDAPYYGENPIGEVNPFADRDIEDVGKRNVKAYMYENPEVKPFFQDEAQVMLRELRDSVKGERTFNDQLYYDTGGEQGWFATKRQTSDEIAYLLDEFKYTYADIERGLKAIIEDHGAENNAISKRIEFMIDERLREGYTDFTSGYDIPNNPDYIALLENKQITEYNDEAYNRWVESLAQDHSLGDTKMVEDIAPVKPSDKKQAKPKQATKDVAPVKEAPKVKGTTEQQEIAKVLTTEPKTESDRNKRKWAIFRANVFDKGTPFEDLSIKKKNRELMGKWNYTLYSEARAQRLMGSGEAKHNVKSLNSIREKVESSGLSKEFQEYMYHKHNIDRMRLKDRFDGMENKPVFGDSVTAEMSQEIVNQYEFAVPEFQEYAQEVYNYNKYLRQQLVDTGVISKETAKLWEQMYPHYVPIRRVGDKGLNVNVPLDTGRTGVNAPIKKATGGSSDILPMFDTMAMRTMQTFKATAKNSFGVELKNTLGVETVKAPTTVDEMIDSIDAQDSLLQEGVNGSKPTFTVFENGERVTFEITEDMYDALKPVSDSSLLSKTIKPLNIASNIHRGLLTEYNPVFMLNNAIKDVQDVLMNSQHATKTYLKIPEAHKQMLTKGYWYNEYMENGGEQNTYFDNETNSFETEKKGVSKALDILPLRAISTANNYIEMIPRLAEYIASREAGRSIEVSMLDSARVTTNFRAGGDLTKFINRNGGTFLNASVQGAMQQVRNVREANMNGLKGWVNLATKFAIAGVPAFLLNNMLWDDDEDYEELSDYVKQGYYVVGKYGDGKFIRIPKGRTVAVIQEGIRQIGNARTGNDEADLKSFLEFVVSNLAPNNPLENNVLAPITQVMNNETWYGEDLVPSRLQDVPVNEQYDESTDSFSRFLGDKLNISPIKINYLLDQYTGGVGDVALPMLTPEAESGDDSLVGNLLAPLKKKFTTDSVMNNQNVSDFYALSDELTLNANKSDATEEDALRNKYINSIKSEMGELYQEKRDIQNAGWMSDKMKYNEVREIQKKIDELSEKTLNSYDSVSISGRYATVGDKQFLMNDEYGWRTLNDEQIAKQEKASDLFGISASEYWKNDDDKYVYDWAVKNPEYYQVSRAISDDVFTYWKHNDHMWNNIRADKDENGKSISGSKKAKIIDYINGIDDLDYEEKLVLFKKYYPADDTYNNEIIEYLNSREDISYEQMETILKELDFEVDEDGNISW